MATEKACALGACIKSIAKEKGFTQRNLAQILGCSIKDIRLLEKGEKLLSFSQLEILADNFSCTVEYILKQSGIWSEK